jgi:hypothetical protein
MKKQLIFLQVISLISLGSCNLVSSISPLSKDKNDLLFEKGFIGKWKEVKNSGGYFFVDTVAGSNGSRYLINVYSHNTAMVITDTTSFYGEIVNINGWKFLDCWFTNYGTCAIKDREDFLINKHFIFQISFPGKDSLAIAALSAEELKRLIDEKKIYLNYTSIKEDEYLLLDKPAVLQKALEASKKYPALYKDKSILIRLQ